MHHIFFFNHRRYKNRIFKYIMILNLMVFIIYNQNHNIFKYYYIFNIIMLSKEWIGGFISGEGWFN